MLRYNVVTHVSGMGERMYKKQWRVAMLISPKTLLRLSKSDVMTRLWVYR